MYQLRTKGSEVYKINPSQEFRISDSQIELNDNVDKWELINNSILYSTGKSIELIKR